jgi:hypothetical protein
VFALPAAMRLCYLECAGQEVPAGISHFLASPW